METSKWIRGPPVGAVAVDAAADCEGAGFNSFVESFRGAAGDGGRFWADATVGFGAGDLRGGGGFRAGFDSTFGAGGELFGRTVDACRVGVGSADRWGVEVAAGGFAGVTSVFLTGGRAVSVRAVAVFRGRSLSPRKYPTR